MIYIVTIHTYIHTNICSEIKTQQQQKCRYVHIVHTVRKSRLELNE
jgi:hypothetical protein